jgi:hypothetical protein
MASLVEFWRKVLRAVGIRPRGPHWVEPSNGVTRAIYEGVPLVTMATWEEAAAPFVPAPPAPVESAPAAQAPESAPAAKPALEEAAPKRPGVAA